MLLDCSASNAQLNAPAIKPVDYSAITIGGELKTRAMKNYDRLESDIYTPDKVFPIRHESTSEGWPGDYEGRVILGLTLEAQATHREPKYLSEMIAIIPSKLNAKGYLGPVMTDSIVEQQLSGHGWFLRGLCEYYEWKKDPRVKVYIQDIINNLAIPTLGYHKTYPIDPAQRNKKIGAAAGSTVSAIGNWKLSSDIGCDFIFLDGIVHAYKLFPSAQLKNLVEEMIARFLQVDLIAINAQTHATLSALRGMLRYYAIEKQPMLLVEAEKRYLLYKTTAMTANYENFNWFDRPEWTEPCAIVDSYLTAVQLWQFTGNPIYLEDAHHIYYNGLANTQRANGGFGLSNCPGATDNTLRVIADEAYWCCTMRGGEGMAKAVQYNYFTGENKLVVPFFNNSDVELIVKQKKIILRQFSEYPFEGKVEFEVIRSDNSSDVEIQLFSPSWSGDAAVTIDGKPIAFKKQNGFITFSSPLVKGSRISYSFPLKAGEENMVNTKYAKPGVKTVYYGPLLLGYNGKGEISLNKSDVPVRSGKEWRIRNNEITLTPVYHLMDSSVNKKSGYHKQVLFPVEKN